jgi:hypothetical protein
MAAKQTNETLTEAERQLFMDPAIDRAYQAWEETINNNNNDSDKEFTPTRKQFLLRIRFLLQQGKLP